MGIGTIGEYIPIISLAMSYPIYYNMYRYYYYYRYIQVWACTLCSEK